MKISKHIFNALLRRATTKKINEDSIYLEFKFKELYLSIYAEKIKDWVISEIYFNEGYELTKKQKKGLQDLINSIKIEMLEVVDEYFENGVKRSDFY